MAWEVKAGAVGSSRWAKWIDIEAASRHFENLRELLERPGTAVLMSNGRDDYEVRFGISWEAEVRLYGALTRDPERTAWWNDRTAKRLERIQKIAESVRGIALACDLLPIALGTYQAARIAANPGTNDLDIYTSAGTWLDAAGPAMRAGVPEVAAYPEVDLRPVCRVDFTNTGVLTVPADAPDPYSGSDGRREFIADATFGWDSWDGWVFKWWTPAAGSANPFAEVSALLPLRLAWEFWSGIARTLLRLKINGALARSGAFITLRNVQLSKRLGGTGLPETIINASAALEVDRLSGDSPLGEREEMLIGSVVALVAAINPVAGAVAGVVVAAAELLLRLLPRAVAIPVDAWGREGYFLERVALTGTLAPRAAPTHAIPPPAGPALVPDPNPWTVGILGENPVREYTVADDGGGGGGGGGALVVAGGLALLAKLLLG
jgi:hypothetical protein